MYVSHRSVRVRFTNREFYRPASAARTDEGRFLEPGEDLRGFFSTRAPDREARVKHLDGGIE